jgi:hypothetical protein
MKRTDTNLKTSQVAGRQPPDLDDEQVDEFEPRSPDFVIKQIRQVPTAKGRISKRETIGGIWMDAATGILTIDFQGEQLIRTRLKAFPTYTFKPSPEQ